MSKEYQKYQHVERFGTDEVDGIEVGECYVFPKIDGTNAHVWHDGKTFRCGSRHRELTLENDNAGFMAWAVEQDNLQAMAKKLKGYHIFGEWLVPHSLKTYREDAWRDFYIFDFVTPDGEHWRYEKWKAFADEYNVNYIAPLRVIKNPTYENLTKCLDANNFLIEDGKGAGEGIVIKNYDFVNRFGRQVWAKIVTSSFKEKHHKEMGAPLVSGSQMIEEQIVEKFLTDEIIDKVLANIKSSGGWNSRYTPRLLQTVFYDFVRECTWGYVKEFKNPKVDFKTLNRFVQLRTKSHLSDLF